MHYSMARMGVDCRREPSCYQEYEIPDEIRLQLWEHYQTFASDILIRFGEFNPEIGYPEQNGHG
jgi:hypothetical protein